VLPAPPISDDQETQIGEGDLLGADLWEESDPRVFATLPDSPEEGRSFVWARGHWFERITADDSGAVEFSPLTMSEHEVREWLSQDDEELTELDDEFARTVREEFLNENPLVPEAPELSNQEYEARP
jgi:hypothetical protein